VQNSKYFHAGEKLACWVYSNNQSSSRIGSIKGIVIKKMEQEQKEYKCFMRKYDGDYKEDVPVYALFMGRPDVRVMSWVGMVMQTFEQT